MTTLHGDTRRLITDVGFSMAALGDGRRVLWWLEFVPCMRLRWSHGLAVRIGELALASAVDLAEGWEWDGSRWDMEKRTVLRML